jgi:FkbM family methyltransferase
MNYNIPINCQIKNLNEIYLNYFSFINNGFFIEVGAYDGETFSNTSFLADIGWKGIYIEPINFYMEKCKTRHSKNDCVFEEHLIADGKEYEMFVNHEWTTIDSNVKDSINRYFGINFNQGGRVKSVTLNEICEKNNVKNIDLLVIDCEGSEEKVLNNFDIKKYKPRMCILELHEIYTPMWHDKNHVQFLERINCFMKLNEYKKIYSDEINTIFIL